MLWEEREAGSKLSQAGEVALGGMSYYAPALTSLAGADNGMHQKIAAGLATEQNPTHESVNSVTMVLPDHVPSTSFQYLPSSSKSEQSIGYTCVTRTRKCSC